MSNEICVLGDIFRHVIMKPSQVESGVNGHDRNNPPYRAYVTFAGAPFLRQMIVKAISSGKDEDLKTTVFPEYHFNQDNCPELSRRLFYILDYFPKSLDKPADMVLRVKPKDAYLTEVFNYNLDKLKAELYGDNNYIGQELTDVQNKHPSLLVIYDKNLTFRKYAENHMLSVSIKNSSGVVIAIKDWGDKTSGKIKYLDFITTELKERCIIITTADDLRRYGVNITLNGSLEQAVHEVVACLNKAPIQSIFGKNCDHFVVVFREVLVVHVSKLKNGTLMGAAHSCPNFKRAIQAEESRYGRMPGRFALMLTAVVKGLYHRNEEIANKHETQEIFEWIKKALRLGVAACASYFDRGYCPKDESNGNDKSIEVTPFDALLKAVSYDQREKLQGMVSKDREFRISSVTFPVTSFGTAGQSYCKPWVRIDSFKKEMDITKDIVKKGLDEALREIPGRGGSESTEAFSNQSFPPATISCPYAEFGDYKTFDAEEARDFYALENLLRKYIGTPEWQKPLSIAVFGQPGSGKNFFVKNIIRNVTKKEVKPLVFNLAQFSELSQLTEAFHKIQDQGLTDNTPVVVFDEFDCNYKSELGWLKFFLAPMQDGEFLGETTTYHIRRAIFVFAGGTAPNFEGFQKQINLNDELKKQVKLADFISRLRGHLDVRDINEKGKGTIEQLRLKRALLLRSFLEQHAEPILKTTRDSEHDHTWEEANIDDTIIDAFLMASEYKHGSRSMEAVIQMCRWINGRFVSASLPLRAQLAKHIDLKPFEDILPPDPLGE
jgi:hypothetical protein